MTDDIDSYRSAKLYIDQRGDEAAIHAAMRADALLDTGDLDGAATWLPITVDGPGGSPNAEIRHCTVELMSAKGKSEPLVEAHRSA